MSAIRQPLEPTCLSPVRALADQAFSRASGAPLVNGNSVKLLKNAKENYPAWLDAIEHARNHVHFERYIIHEDDTGRSFGDALIAKAREGVPVRLIYDWMAKTAVADGRWARVGSSNLNLASWLGNCELDAVIEDERFADQMEAMYLDDLANATEIVLDSKQKLRSPGEPHDSRLSISTSGSGSVGRAAAGAIRLSNTIGAAVTNRRVMESVEARIVIVCGLLLLGLAILFALFPKALVYPLIAVLGWIALALLYRGYQLTLQRKRRSGKSV